MKRIAILMTVHNRQEKTFRCLECLYANVAPKGYVFEVYMTDDGCTDGTPEAVKERFRDVHIIKGNGNLFWNRGMWAAWNVAAKEDFDFYLWLNDDTYLYIDALNMILDLSSKEADKAIIVGATENPEKTEMTYGGYVEGLRQIPQGNPIEVDYFNGNVVLVPRAVFQKLGNLDYYFRHSKGDFDYGFRAKTAGIKMVQTGQIVGACEKHAQMDKWCDPLVSIAERWKAMWSPNGMSPVEFFYFDKKHKGYGSAVTHFLSIISRCLFPSLWLKHKL